MHTVCSHIVQKRLSRENENVATEALTYILGYSAEARAGIMRLLRALLPQMPDLRFQAQQTDQVVNGIVARLQEIANVLSALKRKGT